MKEDEKKKMNEASGNEAEGVYILSMIPCPSNNWVHQFITQVKEKIQVPMFDVWMQKYFLTFA